LQDSDKLLFHISKTIDAQSEDLRSMKENIADIKTEVALLKQKNTLLGRDGVERAKDVASAGGVATVLATIINFFFDKS
jgi:hypothetical protein